MSKHTQDLHIALVVAVLLCSSIILVHVSRKPNTVLVNRQKSLHYVPMQSLEE